MSDVNIPEVTISGLFEAGVHFGHKVSRWNPKMEPYIYGERNGTHIIDLTQTFGLMKEALENIYKVVRKNGKILFVGTTVQAGPVILESAEKCAQYYVNHRWLGGTLTNWSTVSKSIKTLEGYEKILADQNKNPTFTKKEILQLTRKIDKLGRYLNGIRGMNGTPDMIIVLDTRKDRLALREAMKLNIPIVAIVDTNRNPDNITHPIPGNDDSTRSIQHYCDLFAATILSAMKDALADAGVDLDKETGKSLKLGDKNKRVIKYKKSSHVKSRDVNSKNDTQTHSKDFEEKLGE